MKIRLWFLLVVLCSPFLASAQPVEQHLRGFKLGFGAASGYESYTLQRLGVGGQGRFGYRFSRFFQLNYEGAGSYTHYQGQDIGIWDNQIKPQFFVWKDLYFLPGAGVTFAHIVSSRALRNTSSRNFVTPLGVMGSLAIGNAFPIAKRVSLALEAEINWRFINDNRLAGKNYWSELVRLHFTWHL